jgi:tetratricopeptide (TPR) repeat protein
MQQPSNPEELWALHKLLDEDPFRYLDIVNRWIEETPDDPDGYFDRHFVWLELGELERALEDMNRVIALKPTQIDLRCRGNVFRRLGDYAKAAEDYETAEALDPAQWEDDAIPLLFQADVHAALGDVFAALDCCNRLPDEFWTPGPFGLPPGDKAEIADELKRRAAGARAAARSR